MTVQDDINAIVATEASIYTTRAAATPLLNTLINAVNALPNSGVRTKVLSALTPFILQYNKLAPLVNDLHGEVPKLAADFIMLLAIGIISSSAPAASPSQPKAAAWQPLKLGGGGWDTGQDLTPDGTHVVRSDTNGAYLIDPVTKIWHNLITRDSLPNADAIDADLYGGCWEIRIAPSNSNRGVMQYKGWVYYTDTLKSSPIWIKISASLYPRDTSAGADFSAARLSGQKLAIDPINPDVWFLGNTTTGLWFTLDKGASWTNVSTATIPVADDVSGITGIVFDETSAPVGGRCQVIYVASHGHGVWKSTNGGTSWTQIANGSSSPSNVVHAQLGFAIADGHGIYYCADATSGGWKYDGSTWTNFDPLAVHSIATSRVTHGRLVAFHDHGSNFNQYLNEGIAGSNVGPFTWNPNFPSPGINNLATSPEPQWLAYCNDRLFKSLGDGHFDPITDELVISEGVGSWRSELLNGTPGLPTTFVAFNWRSQSRGLEQLVAAEIVSVPGGNLFLGVADRAIFVNPNTTSYPLVNYPNNSFSLSDCRSIAYQATAPAKIMALVNTDHTFPANDNSCYSLDGGATWSVWGAFPANNTSHVGGCLAVNRNDIDNVVVCQGNNGDIYRTNNATAATPVWAAIPASSFSPNVPTSGTKGWVDNYFLNRKILWADPLVAGTFYVYNWTVPAASTGAARDGALYKSTDKGVTWAMIFAGTISLGNGNNFHAKFKPVFTKSTDVFYTDGNQGSAGDGSTPGDNPAAFTDFKACYNINGSPTWVTVLSQAEVWDFDFGAPRIPGGYPALYIWGWIGGVPGIYRSENANLGASATFTLLSSFPLGAIQQQGPNIIGADKNIFGRVYVGQSHGGGFATADFTT